MYSCSLSLLEPRIFTIALAGEHPEFRHSLDDLPFLRQPESPPQSGQTTVDRAD